MIDTRLSAMIERSVFAVIDTRLSAVIDRRVLELQTADYRLGEQMRTPAISRLQKVHNVAVVFKALSDRGVDVHTYKGTAAVTPYR